jgi:outer membrane lipoprotein-sorting protein
MTNRSISLLALVAVAGTAACPVLAREGRTSQDRESPSATRVTAAWPTPTPVPAPFREAGPEDSLASVQSRIERMIARVDTVTCEVEMSKKREKKVTRKVEKGPLELRRGMGARVVLTRKGETNEYIANQKVIWSYDHNDKEAHFIPTSMPVVGACVQEAMRLNAFFAMEKDTVRLRGSQEIEGEDCWVLTGKSPSTLKSLGVPSVKVRVWVAKRDGLPRKIHLPDEDDLVVMLRGVSVNAPVPPSAFEWTPPRGVRTRNIFGF